MYLSLNHENKTQNFSIAVHVNMPSDFSYSMLQKNRPLPFSFYTGSRSGSPSVPNQNSGVSMFSRVRTYFLCLWGRVCLCGSEREKVRLEVVYKVHDPLPFSLFELITLPVSNALSVLCKRQRKVRGLVDLTVKGTSLKPEIHKTNPKHWMENKCK